VTKEPTTKVNGNFFKAGVGPEYPSQTFTFRAIYVVFFCWRKNFAVNLVEQKKMNRKMFCFCKISTFQ
jgi:hypothetical protein